jgi:hypothetical protein
MPWLSLAIHSRTVPSTCLQWLAAVACIAEAPHAWHLHATPGGTPRPHAQVLLPAAFFLVMWLPKHYIPPVSHGQQLTSLAPDLESRWWSGPNPYSGGKILGCKRTHAI